MCTDDPVSQPRKHISMVIDPILMAQVCAPRRTTIMFWPCQVAVCPDFFHRLRRASHPYRSRRKCCGHGRVTDDPPGTWCPSFDPRCKAACSSIWWGPGRSADADGNAPPGMGSQLRQRDRQHCSTLERWSGSRNSSIIVTSLVREVACAKTITKTE